MKTSAGVQEEIKINSGTKNRIVEKTKILIRRRNFVHIDDHVENMRANLTYIPILPKLHSSIHHLLHLMPLILVRSGDDGHIHPLSCNCHDLSSPHSNVVQSLHYYSGHVGPAHDQQRGNRCVFDVPQYVVVRTYPSIVDLERDRSQVFWGYNSYPGAGKLLLEAVM
jgi:hypothetical protein